MKTKIKIKKPKAGEGRPTAAKLRNPKRTVPGEAEKKV